MSIRLASQSATAVGRSAKTIRQPWCAYGGPIVHFTSGFISASTTAANTKGSWVPCVASTSSDTGLICLHLVGFQPSGDRGNLCDIGVGPTGQEQVLVSNIAFGNTSFSQIPMIVIPAFIPAGSRVAFRLQTAASSGGFNPGLTLNTTPDARLLPSVSTGIDTYGANTATSRGTALLTAAGQYREIAAATTRPYQALVLVPSNGNPSASGSAGVNTMTLAIGIQGLEIDVLSVYNSNGFNSPGNPCPPFLWVGRHVPAGTRLSVKHNAASNGNLLEAVVLGVPYG